MSAGSPLAAFFAIPPSQMRVQGSVQPPRKPQAVSQDMAVRIGVMMGASQASGSSQDGSVPSDAAARAPASAPSTAKHSKPLYQGREGPKPGGARIPGRSQKGEGPRAGEWPNVMFRAIPLDHLRRHPLFSPLPHEDEVEIKSVMDVPKLRQESWQWAVLHSGRLTTSNFAAVCGLYEPASARALGVPRSLSGHSKAMRAYDYLTSTPVAIPEGLQEPPLGMRRSSGIGGGVSDSKRAARRNRKKGGGRNHQKSDMGGSAADGATGSEMWVVPSQENATFPYEYVPGGAPEVRLRVSSVGQARMTWGNTQEATSILAGLNYLAGEGATVCEAGLCPLECVGLPKGSEWGDMDSLPLIGASPDAIVRGKDGKLRALEVKSHAPFAPGGTTKKSSAPGKFIIRDPGPRTRIAPWHIPQLQAEMLCLGEDCQSCLFVSSSATKGAVVLELQRDDAYIQGMLAHARYFKRTFVDTGREPHWDFADDMPGHEDFVAMTLKVADSAKVVAEIEDVKVQRSPRNPRFFLKGGGVGGS